MCDNNGCGDYLFLGTATAGGTAPVGPPLYYDTIGEDLQSITIEGKWHFGFDASCTPAQYKLNRCYPSQSFRELIIQDFEPRIRQWQYRPVGTDDWVSVVRTNAGSIRSWGQPAYPNGPYYMGTADILHGLASGTEYEYRVRACIQLSGVSGSSFVNVGKKTLHSYWCRDGTSIWSKIDKTTTQVLLEV